MNRSINKVLSSSLLWALVPTFIASSFLRDVGKPYTLTVKTDPTNPAEQICYYDLNGDGLTERIHAKPGNPLNNIPVMTAEGAYYNQWNIPDEFVAGVSDLYFGDFDNDGLTEMYVFTAKQDSIFLHANEIFDSAGMVLKRKFITIVNRVEKQINSTLKPFGFFDEDNDGSKEFYFAITTGFGLWPRHCYSFNFRTQQLRTSSFTGINFNHPMLTDLDGDQRPEIISPTTAAGNYNTPTPYTDYSAWLMVLDHELKFKFTPVEFPGFGGRLDVYPMKEDGKTYLVVAYKYNGAQKPVRQPGLMIYNANGKLIRSKTFADFGLSSAKVCIAGKGSNQKIILLGTAAHVLNSELETVDEINIPVPLAYSVSSFDLEQDGLEELIFYSSGEKKLIVCNNDLDILAETAIDIADSEWKPIPVSNPSGENYTIIKDGDKIYTLKLVHNDYYVLGYLTYVAIYSGFLLMIWSIRKITTYQIEKREALRQKLLNLQLQSIKSQLDPHFTFNALNSISSLLYLDDRKSAYDALNIFTRLLRQLLNDADQVLRPLQDEINFVTSYLSLEKMRFSTLLSYEIVIGTGVTGKELVPKMALQTFAENAIKHGLVPKQGDGQLLISVNIQDAYLLLTVEDNGIGREKAAGQNGTSGRGLKINGEFYETLNQISSQKIRHLITDLFDSQGNPAGTRVEVWVPSDLDVGYLY